MLAQVALIAFAFLSLLALVVDLGFARVTQAQMQTAADTAALEGLRYRDVGVVNPATGQSVPNAFASDCIRRAAAHRVVRTTFDDDYDPTSEDPDYQFGAGPIIDLTEGQTSLHALQTMSVGESHVYEPNLQLNQQNAVEGDMVSGRFCYNADPAPSEGAAYDSAGTVVCTEAQRGIGTYARNDFNPSIAEPQAPAALPECPLPDDPPPSPWPASGPGSITNAQHGAFLVRLRRSNEMAERAAQTEPSVASSGPSLPLLFGRGAPIFGDDPESAYSVRRDGLTVRATAIADARPALRVGLPSTNPPQPGVTPFAVAQAFAASVVGPPLQLTINPANGLICTGTACAGAAPPTGIGRYVDALTNPARPGSRAVATVGLPLPPPVAVSCAVALPAAGFTPVYAAMTSGVTRVIGFARFTLNRDPARPTNMCAATITRNAASVAASNATALLAAGLPLPPGTPPAEIRELMDRHFARVGLAYGPVLVPVLVR